MNCDGFLICRVLLGSSSLAHKWWSIIKTLGLLGFTLVPRSNTFGIRLAIQLIFTPAIKPVIRTQSVWEFLFPLRYAIERKISLRRITYSSCLVFTQNFSGYVSVLFMHKRTMWQPLLMSYTKTKRLYCFKIYELRWTMNIRLLNFHTVYTWN